MLMPLAYTLEGVQHKWKEQGGEPNGMRWGQWTVTVRLTYVQRGRARCGELVRHLATVRPG